MLSIVVIVVGIRWLSKPLFSQNKAPDLNPVFSLFDKNYIEPNRQKINVDEVITQLIEKLKEKRDLKRHISSDKIFSPEDNWTSKSMTMAVFGHLLVNDMNLKTSIPLRECNDTLAQKISFAIQNQNVIPLVDLKDLDETLKEFNLYLSDLVDRKKDLIRIGKILGARFILFSEYTHDEKKPKIAINVIETETTVIKVSFTSKLGKGENYEEIADQIAKKLVKKILERYPLKGKIIAVNDDAQVMLNLGSDFGLQRKNIMAVLSNLDGTEQIGLIEIIKVDRRLALAKILKAKRLLKIGDRVILSPY